MPWSAEQLYDLVADVEKYPEFIPWCTAARIRRCEGDVFWTDLVIGFKVFCERFTSEVSLTPKSQIDVRYTDGPFKHMRNRWMFLPQDDDSCIVDFDIDFEFKSFILQKTIGALFHEAVRRMVAAFEERARELYGSGTGSGESVPA